MTAKEYLERTRGISEEIELLCAERDKAFAAELTAVRSETLSVINELEDSVQRRILIMRHIRLDSWSEISAAVGYERSYVFRLYAKALKKIDKILKEATKSD